MKHTLTLTRWHKVAERINGALKEAEARAVAAFTTASISPWNKEGIEQKVASMAARGKADLALVEQGSAAVAAIRSALGRRNAELGIADRLAEAEAAHRRTSLYRAVLDKQSVDMVQPEHVRHVPAGVVPESEPSWGRREPARITLQVADASLLAELASKLAREQARSHALLDEIADLNREKLELEVAPE
ncbi:MAG: hypothetical protein ACREI7_02305, partial [Myxococcota bacterium]